MFREGCRAAHTWLQTGLGGRVFSLQKAIPGSSGLRTTSPELGPCSRASLGNTIHLVGRLPSEESCPSCPPSSPFVFPTYSIGRVVVCYIPEGRLMTAGEGKPGSWAPEASGQRGEGRGTGGRSGTTAEGDERELVGNGVHTDPKWRDQELFPIVCHTPLWVAQSTVNSEGSRSAMPLTGPFGESQPGLWNVLLFQAPL